MFRQIEWWLRNGPVTKGGVLLVTNLYFWKFCFSLRTFHKEFVWCTNNPNAYIRTFCKRWSSVWRCFLPASVLKEILKRVYLENSQSSLRFNTIQWISCIFPEAFTYGVLQKTLFWEISPNSQDNICVRTPFKCCRLSNNSIKKDNPAEELSWIITKFFRTTLS